MAVCDNPAFFAIKPATPVRTVGRHGFQRFGHNRLNLFVAIERGAPVRGSSSKPSSRFTRKRSRHLQTVAPVICNFLATAPLLNPSSQPRTMRARIATLKYIFGRFGPDSDLRRWGLRIAALGGRRAKKRTVAAVARRPAVLLHHLWVIGEVYEPLHNNQQEAA